MIKVIVFDYYGVLYRPKTQDLDEKVLSLAKRLSSKYNCVILSNIPSIGGEISQYSDVGDRGIFKNIFTSGDIGFTKPDPRSFLYVCNQLSVSPDECLLIDDSEINCSIASDLGFCSINYTDFPKLKITIDSALNNKG